MKIKWNKVTWYSKLLALVMLVILPFVGFYLGIQFQKTAIPVQNQISTNLTQNQTMTNQTETNIKSPLPTPVVLNPKPGALNVRDILANPTKYLNQKIKVTARVDIHTNKASIMCVTSPCQQFKGTVYLKDINGSYSNEILLAEKSRTDPSGYIEFGCFSNTQTIETCADYKNNTLTELEGTLVGQPTDTIDHYIYLLII